MTYLDVSVVRIQSYLTRTTDLRGFRGASEQVSTITTATDWNQQLKGRAKRNDAAGEIDGVVSLELEATADELDVARAVVGHLRDALPAAYLTAVSASAGDYVSAYGEMSSKRDQGDLLIDEPPAVSEVFLAKPCSRCQAWPAVARIADHSHNVTVDGDDVGCADCIKRYSDVRSTETRTPRVEKQLLGAIEARSANGQRPLSFPRDFNKLANGDNLAMIYCDGNKIGDFIQAATKQNIKTSEIAPAINGATIDSVAVALKEVCVSEVGIVDAIPHILGGDDIQITVPAGCGWLFALHLAAEFARLTAGMVPGRGLPKLSISTGLVFFHRKTPLRDVFDSAAVQLKAAKQEVRGREASIAFLDLPMDGESAPATRRPFTVAELTGWRERLNEVALIPAAQRNSLLELVRGERVEEALERAKFGGHDVIVQLHDDPKGIAIRDQLEIARWWSK